MKKGGEMGEYDAVQRLVWDFGLGQLAASRWVCESAEHETRTCARSGGSYRVGGGQVRRV